jgi:glycosyltransferase involved in cell wall biosynthesis
MAYQWPSHPEFQARLLQQHSMRILFFSHYFPPEGNAPANRTYENSVRWAKAGHDVTVITCAPNVPDGVVYRGYRNRWWPQRENVEGINVIRVWTWLAPNSGFIGRIVNYLSYMVTAVIASIFLRRPQVVIATSPQFFCGWAGVLACYLKWTPFVLEIRDIWPESIITVEAMRRGLLLRLLERLECWMYAAATHIVAVGEGYCDNIKAKTNNPVRVSVISNGVDIEQFVPAAPSKKFLEQWGLADKFVCSYVGTIGMAHGLDITIRAAKRLRAMGRDDIRFLLVGDGAYRCQLEREAVESGVADLVRFTGRLPRPEMPVVLASSNVCLIHLRKAELFKSVIPSKMFEIMAMGRPIVMGVDGLARQIVLEAEAGTSLEPDSDEELARIVCDMADHPDEITRQAARARDYVVRRYNRDALAMEYLRLLSTVCGESDRSVSPTSVSVMVNRELQ